MANHARTRKRVHAIIPRRAPNGSAFQNCDICGESVAISLADMHECGTKKELKRFKGFSGTQNGAQPVFPWQPRSAFNIFMEGFVINKKGENLIDIDRKGFETWKCMSEEERQPYVTKAEKSNAAYIEHLIELEKYIPEREDDEADSAMVGKFDKFYGNCEYYKTSDDDDELYHFAGAESLNTSEWKTQQHGTNECSSSS